MLNTHTEQLFDGTGTFIKELFHLPQFRGKALVIFNTVVLVVSMDRLSAAETVNNIT